MSNKIPTPRYDALRVKHAFLGSGLADFKDLCESFEKELAVAEAALAGAENVLTVCDMSAFVERAANANSKLAEMRGAK
jgi:DeoR/GlpR family transcriptional regulator of sugar metabolism